MIKGSTRWYNWWLARLTQTTAWFARAPQGGVFASPDPVRPKPTVLQVAISFFVGTEAD